MKNKKLNILMAAAEINPFAKAGGLADVAGSLPPAIKKLGHDVRLIMPKYGLIDEKKYKLKKIVSNFEIPTAKNSIKINLWKAKLPGHNVIVYFIDNKKYFGRKSIYWGNDSERFLFFSLAVVHILPRIKFKPDIMHCHDFHTAMIIDLIKASNLYNSYYQDTKSIYTIHNLNYQGVSELDVLSTGNLSKDLLKSLTKDAQDGDINFMAQGIVNADMINTVSPTYAKEITTSTFGAGLSKVIRANKDKLVGIINGLDLDFFNPEKDSLVKHKYNLKTLHKKDENKKWLQKKMGLPVNENTALVGLVSRIVWQKGINLITEDLVSDLGCQFVFLGSGQKEYEDQLKKLAKKYPKKVKAHMKFSLELAPQIYAGSDIFIVPSRYEPCGLGQMIAMRYGAVPVVRATGGLADTVDKKVGFKFKEFKKNSLKMALHRALNVYYDQPKKWQKLKKNGMKRDFSWDKSAKKYVAMYQKTLNK